jgi:hypothetical protein
LEFQYDEYQYEMYRRYFNDLGADMVSTIVRFLDVHRRFNISILPYKTIVSQKQYFSGERFENLYIAIH